MAQVAMTDAVTGTVASSAEYNKVTANIRDLATTSAGGGRVGALETLTTNTSGTVGIGNQRLSDRLGPGITTAATADDRFGTGVGTGSNVTTGSASSQLTDLRSRATALESTTTNGTSGNSALNSRVAVLEGATAPLIARVVRATNQSIANNTTTVATWDAISWSSAPTNPNSIWAGGNPTRLTVPSGQGGLYQVQVQFVFSPNATGNRQAMARKNGTTAIRGIVLPNNGAGNFTEMSLTFHLTLAAADYIELTCWQNSGGALNIQAEDPANTISCIIRKLA